MSPSVAVDFDGVIHTYEHGWLDGTIYGDWVPGSVEGINLLMRTHPVFIFSSRDPESIAQWIRSTSSFLCTTRVPDSGFWRRKGVLLVTDRKLPAVAYLDDRAVRFKSWPNSLKEILAPRRI